MLLHNAMTTPGTSAYGGMGISGAVNKGFDVFILRIAISENQKLIESIRRVLETLPQNQTEHGHIPSLVQDEEDRRSSDTSPLFLLGVGIFRKMTDEHDFLQDAVSKSLTWMEYHSPSNRDLVAQQPTSDWRDEQWVTGYGMFVNNFFIIYIFKYQDTY